MERKGLLTPVQEEFLTEVIFHRVTFPKWFPKWFSKPVLLRVVRMIDNLVLHRIHPTVRIKLIPFIDAAHAGRINDVRTLAADLGASKIDIKYVSADRELEMVDSWTRVIVSHTLAYLEYRDGKKAYQDNA